MVTLLVIGIGIALVWALAYHRRAARTWVGSLAVALVAATWVLGASLAVVLAWLLALAGVALCYPSRLRREYVSRPLLQHFRKALPDISASERIALEAGTVWWDGELLSGNPDWRKLRALRMPELTAEERAFLQGPVEELCEMLDEWRITHELHDLPPAAWDYIKRRGFLGMIIPKAYGGLGFSALAHSEVIMKLTSRSSTAAVSVMVPNSLGPAELLLNYGTQEQKDYYLPRLARGEEIPCFALTSPEAGSDAGSIPDFGIVCRGSWRGRDDVLGISLTWEKRYITLGPIATLLGLAFRLYDPDGLLGPRADVGITLALIPTDTPGVEIGRRHLPLDAAFMNGPNWGKNVFIPMDQVIGGVERIGEGWAMLMNCLAAGRSISLPANSCGVAKMCALTTGAYSRVRRQFGVPLGRFEGIEAALARIGGNAYIMEAARRMTALALDLGEKPTVVSAIVKSQLTERVREVVNHAMDVHGGKAICMGPSNYLAQAYQQVPIAITVEGANILTRSMIIFGQGAIRSHPYLLAEIEAGREPDAQRAVRDFDRALFGHVSFFAANAARTLWLGLTGARWARVPGDAHTRRHYAQLTRYSSALAFLADAVLAAVGGSLKRRERLSARLGDILSLLYLGSCVLKRYEDQGSPSEDRPLLEWAMSDTLAQTQQAFVAVFENLRPVWLARTLSAMVFPGWGGASGPPSDRIESDVAQRLQEPGSLRARLVSGVFVSRRAEDAVATLEAAFRAAIEAEPVETRIRRAWGGRKPAGVGEDAIALQARADGIITDAEVQVIARANRLRRAAIMVDDFPHDFGATAVYQTTQAVTFEALATESDKD